MNDPLIDRLVSDLKPAAPIKDSYFWNIYMVLFFGFTTFILVTMGIRYDVDAAIENMAMFWKPSIFVMLWLGGAALITDFSRPEGRAHWQHILPLCIGGGLLIWQFFVQKSMIFSEDTMQAMGGSGVYSCLCCIILGGLVAMAVSWKLWLSKTASRMPGLLGLLWGGSAGCISAAGYSMHCHSDQILYIILFYCLPILGLSLLGFFVGRKYLQW